MRNVLVLGSGRSGTSMLAGTIAGGGYFVGTDPYPGRASNEKGFFEARDVNGINECLLASVEPRHSGMRAWQRWLSIVPPGTEFSVGDALRARMNRLVKHTPYCFKDPRFCYTLPAWRASIPDARFVVVFREPSATSSSMARECQAAPYLQGMQFDTERGFEVWNAMYRRILDQHSRSGDWLFLHFDQVLSAAGLERVESFLDARVARSFPEARLRHEHAPAPVSDCADATYRELCERASFQPRGNALARARSTANLGVASESNAVSGSDSDKAHALSTSTTMPEISVILCTYNRREVLAESLQAFENQTAPEGSYELVVVDDGSLDGTGAWLAERGLRVPGTIISRPNGGLSAARNSGIAKARGKYLLFVNDDTIAFPDLIEQHLAAHREIADETVAVLGTFEQPVAALDNALMRYLETSSEVFCYPKIESGGVYAWDRFWTCNVSVSSELVRRAGNFDESFRRYGCEDTDLALRLDELGVRVYFHGGARAHHRHLLDLAALKRRQLTLAQAYVSLFKKHPRALLHGDWAWVRSLSLEDAERYCDERLPGLPALEEAANELARMDLGAVEHGGQACAPVLQGIVDALGDHVRALNAIWWRQGLAAGLVEHRLASFRELVPSEGAWPLATDAPIRLLAWPDWSGTDLEALWRNYGELVTGRPDVCLVLRHDPCLDVEIDRARQALAESFEASRWNGRALDVLILDDPLDALDLPQVARSVTSSLRLPSSGTDPARSFFAALEVEQVSRTGLAKLLGAERVPALA